MFCHGTGYDEDDDKCGMCLGRGNNLFYRRVIIPSYENGNLVFFQGRAIDNATYEDKVVRYMNPRAPRMQVVYFYDLLKENEDIYITEGPMDAMSLIDYSCTCLLSQTISDPQVLKIAQKHPKRVIFIPDYDETAGKRETVFGNMEANIAKFVRLTDGKIPVGIYHWYRAFSDSDLKRFKDINGAGITQVDPSLIEMKEL